MPTWFHNLVLCHIQVLPTSPGVMAPESSRGVGILGVIGYPSDSWGSNHWDLALLCYLKVWLRWTLGPGLDENTNQKFLLLSMVKGLFYVAAFVSLFSGYLLLRLFLSCIWEYSSSRAVGNAPASPTCYWFVWYWCIDLPRSMHVMWACCLNGAKQYFGPATSWLPYSL